LSCQLLRQPKTSLWLGRLKNNGVQLNLLNELLEKYGQMLEEKGVIYNELLWEIQEGFQKNWDIEAPEFKEMYAQSINSNISRRLWKLRGGDAKNRMLDLIDQDAEFARTLFKGLFDEEKDLSYRISHFQFGCEVLMEEFRKKNVNSIENDHFHQDNHMTTLYLSLKYPNDYALFYSDKFISFLKNLGVQQLPPPNDYDRFYKVSRTVLQLINKNEKLISIVKETLPAPYQEQYNYQFLFTDFYRWASNPKLANKI